MRHLVKNATRQAWKSARQRIGFCNGTGLLMKLNESAALFHDSLQLVMHCRECIAYRDINILVLLPINSKLIARQRNVDRDAIWPSLMLMFCSCSMLTRQAMNSPAKASSRRTCSTAICVRLSEGSKPRNRRCKGVFIDRMLTARPPAAPLRGWRTVIRSGVPPRDAAVTLSQPDTSRRKYQLPQKTQRQAQSKTPRSPPAGH